MRVLIALIMVFGFSSSALMAQDGNAELSFFNHITGIWHGPVYSSSSAGSFNSWHLDFRPIAENEIAQFSMLDSNTINNMFFFIAEYEGSDRLTMRTEGCFRNQCCVTYEFLDSADIKTGYFRFSDCVAGDSRAYTEFIFTDSTMLMQVYTTKFGGITIPALHTRLNAVKGDPDSKTSSLFIKDFPILTPKLSLSGAFDDMEESIFYAFDQDNYSLPENQLSSVTINIGVDSALNLDDKGEIFLLLCTQSMYNGLKIKENYQDYYSRYVFLPKGTKKYTLKNVHPGKYYLYSFADQNGDCLHLSGDYMSSNPENVFELKPGMNITIHTTIDMIIP